jgi:hypothetical protein
MVFKKDASQCPRSKFVPVQPITAYRGSRGITPLFLNLSTRWRRAVNSTPQLAYPWERTPTPSGQEAVKSYCFVPLLLCSHFTFSHQPSPCPAI